MSVRDSIIHIPEPPRARDSWAGAYLVESTRITDLYSRAIEDLIEDRGGFLFGADGKRERTTVMGVIIDERS